MKSDCHRRTPIIPALLSLSAAALGRPYNYPAPPWWNWLLIALGFVLGWTAHEIGHRMSAPSLRPGPALCSQPPACAVAAASENTTSVPAAAGANANGEHQPAPRPATPLLPRITTSSPGKITTTND